MTEGANGRGMKGRGVLRLIRLRATGLTCSEDLTEFCEAGMGDFLADSPVAGVSAGLIKHRFAADHHGLMRAVGIDTRVDEIKEGLSGGQIVQ